MIKLQKQGEKKMSTFKLNEQIAFLRKQKEITQEELAQILGVTNQSVSKWESGNCCPDIQLLPRIADYFGISIDELIGYKPTDTFENVYFKIKSLFEATSEEQCFDLAYKFAFLLAEGASTKGYKGYVPWKTDKIRTEDEEFYNWGLSVCSEPEGNAVVKGNSVFISSNRRARTITSTDIREIYNTIEPFQEKNNLRVFFALYELTVSDFELYVPVEVISEKCNLPINIVEKALDKLPIQLCSNEQNYRIDNSYMHIAPMLLMMAR